MAYGVRDLFGDIPLVLAVATPRVRNNNVAYKESEAARMQFFVNKYGSAPLRNNHIEHQKYGHSYAATELREALTPGKGMRFRWAIQPMKANKFYKTYVTHKAQ